jgi:membrane peptidoglycan carboxypeptidase
MRKSDNGLVANAASLLICGLLAGVVVAAAAFPLVAFSGLAAKAGGEAFGQLPDELTVKRTPQISYVYASDNKTLLATMYDENRRDLPLSAIPEVVQKAMLAAEDQKFYEHNGVDVKGFARAFIANKTSGEVEQGASTITMQLVRMSLTFTSSPENVIQATEDTNPRKLREIRYAIALEQQMSKDQILENYLNTAYFGLRSYGIFAAAQVYFKKELNDLTLGETAFLVSLVKSPSDLDNQAGKDRMLVRRNYVLDEMVELKYISREIADAAKAEKLEIIGFLTPNGCVQANTNHWGFFCDYFQRWWERQEVFGATKFDRERQLRSGGFRITTTMDLTVQEAAYRNAVKQAPIGDPNALMLAAIEPGTGKVRALAVNRNFQLDTNNENGLHTNPKVQAAAPGTKGSYPNTTNPLLSADPAVQGYRPGSVMKVYTAIAALENGYPLDTVINTQATAVSKYRHKLPPNCGGYWCPPNDGNRVFGPVNMWEAFGRSVNTYFVPLFDMVGGDKVMSVAKRMGLSFYDVPDNPADTPGNGTKDDDYYSSTANSNIWSPFTLGISTHHPLEIANTFATLAADGVYCEPTPIETIHNFKKEKLDISNAKCEQRFDPEVARAAIDMARCPVGETSQVGGRCGGSTAGDSKRIIGRPIAGKTGTADNKSSSTYTVTTKQLAMSGFLTNPDWPDTDHDMDHTGPRGVNPAVQYAMAEAMADKPAIQFTAPTNPKIIMGTQSAIADVTCKPVAEATAILKGQGFKVEVDKRVKADSACPLDHVAYTTPSIKTLRNGVVTLVLSNGAAAGPPPGNGGGGGGGGGNGPRPKPSIVIPDPPRRD